MLPSRRSTVLPIFLWRPLSDLLAEVANRVTVLSTPALPDAIVLSIDLLSSSNLPPSIPLADLVSLPSPPLNLVFARKRPSTKCLP